MQSVYRLSIVFLIIVAGCVPPPRGGARAEPSAREATALEADPIRYLASRRLMVPVEGVSPADLLDDFNARRGSRTHQALDISAPRGTPVLSADDGRVLRLSENRSGGITVYAVDSNERLVYYYAHLQGYRRGLRAGDSLRRGDVIGYVGTSGNAPSHVPHLHFQVMRLDDPRRYWEGTPLNPYELFAARGERRR